MSVSSWRRSTRSARVEGTRKRYDHALLPAASLVFGFWSLVRGGERDVEDAAEDDGAAVLGDLVPVREIRVEVVFAIEVTDALDLAAEGEAEARGEVHRARVHGGKRAGERGVEGSDVRVHVAAVIAGALRGAGRVDA